MQTNLDNVFKMDTGLESQGVWFEVAAGVAFLIKRFGGANSAAVKKALAKYHKPYARLIENDTIAEDLLKEITAKAFVSASLIDWKGIEIDGKETPFDGDMAVSLFIERPELFNTLWNHANDSANYKEDLGNF